MQGVCLLTLLLGSKTFPEELSSGIAEIGCGQELLHVGLGLCSGSYFLLLILAGLTKLGLWSLGFSTAQSTRQRAAGTHKKIWTHGLR